MSIINEDITEKQYLNNLGYKNITDKIFGDEYYYIFLDKLGETNIKQISIYERLSDCLNRDDNFGICLHYTYYTVADIKELLGRLNII